MVNQIINVNKKKYAVGLLWQPMAAGYVPRGYARTLSKSIDKKLNLFLDYKSMIGLGSSKQGHRIGMYSAAAEITNAFSEYSSFLGVFSVDKNFYLVAVRNGIILQDKLLDNEEQAREEYFKLSELPDWAGLFAPSSWGMPRSVDRNLSDVISSATTKVNLKPISRIRSSISSILLIAIFVFALVAIFKEPLSQLLLPQAQIAEINPELAAEYKKQIEEKNKELDKEFNIEKQPEPEPIVLPYDNLPDPMARAEVCYKAMAFLMQPIPGWNQEWVECGETHAVTQFKRDFGTLVDFYNIATEKFYGAYVQENSESSLTVRATLPAVKTQASLDERDAVSIVRDVNSLFQGMNTSVDTNITIDVLTNGVETKTLNIVEVSAESKLIPVQFMEIFSEFGGVYMTRCVWDTSTKTWNYEVIIYAK